MAIESGFRVRVLGFQCSGFWGSNVNEKQSPLRDWQLAQRWLTDNEWRLNPGDSERGRERERQ